MYLLYAFLTVIVMTKFKLVNVIINYYKCVIVHNIILI